MCSVLTIRVSCPSASFVNSCLARRKDGEAQKAAAEQGSRAGLESSSNGKRAGDGKGFGRFGYLWIVFEDGKHR